MIVLLAMQGGDGGAGLARADQDLADVGPEHRVGADLEEHPAAVGHQGAHRVGEAHRVAHVAAPVFGIPVTRGDPLPGHRRIQRQHRIGELQVGQRAPQLVEDRLHQVAVVGHLDVQPLGENALGGEAFGDLVEPVHRPGEGHRAGAVDRGDIDPRVAVDEVAGRGGCETDREHAARAGRACLQARPVVAHQQRVVQRQHAGDVRRRHLTDAVPDHRGGADAEFGERGDQRHLHEEVGRLRDGGAGDPRVVLGAQQLLDDGPAGDLAEDRVDAAGLGGEGAVGRQQLPAHPPPLRAHTGEHEHRLGGAARDHLGRPPRAAVGQLDQSAHQVGLVAEGHRGAVGVVLAAGPGGFGEALRIAARGDLFGEAAGQLPHGRFAAARQRQHAVMAGWPRRTRRRHVLLEDGVRVGAAVAETVDRDGHPLHFGADRFGLELEPDPQFVEGDLRVRLVQPALRRDRAVRDGQRRLDHARDARGRLGVPELPLHRTDPERPGAAGHLPVGAADGPQLQRVTHGGAGAVRLDVGHLVRRDTGPFGDRLGQCLLQIGVRHRDGGGAAVLIGPGRLDHRVDAVAVAFGVGEFLEHDHARALAAAVAVGGGVERLAAAVGGQEAALAHGHERFGLQQHGDAARHRHLAVAVVQRLTGQVQGDQRGRARRVDGDGGPDQVERVGDPVGQHGVGGADGGVHVHVRQRVTGHRHRQLVQGERADVDADRPARHPARDARVVERLPGHLEDQALLRVHRGRFARGDTEEVGVEFPRIAGHEGGAFGVHAARGALVRVVEAPVVPALRWDVDHAVAFVDQEVPERFRRIDTARVPATDTDNGDVRHNDSS
ncbi:hypothetical protein CJ468_05891 [Nocardia farcinica]|nr:hypothetical protein CJ468_05891 [Nocardia farcinica]